MAFNFFKSLLPTVKAQEEELVDPQAELREKCSKESHAAHLMERYQTCNNRVNSRSKTTETCQEELFDYLHALDHCVVKSLFPRLK